jgi:hypothetical protein
MGRKKQKKKNMFSKEWKGYEALIARFLTSLFEQVDGLPADSVGHAGRTTFTERPASLIRSACLSKPRVSYT